MTNIAANSLTRNPMPKSDHYQKNLRLFQYIGLSIMLLNLLLYVYFGKEVLQAGIVLSICGVILFIIIKVVSG
jgi:hypothetical protein